MALKFLNKKGWHTGSLRNIENVWKAEQKNDAEQKKLEELRKQIQEERERAEFRLLQEQAGLVPIQERLDFLYDSGLAVGKGSSEGFKALEAPPPQPPANNAEASSSKQANAPGALFEDKPQSANDTWRKLHSDPLLLIRQREQEALSRIKNNPIQMAMIRKSAESKKKHKEEKHKKKEHTKHRKKSKHERHSSKQFDSEGSMSDRDEEGRKRGHQVSLHRKTSKREKHSSGGHSDSEGVTSEGEERRKRSHQVVERHKSLKREKHSQRSQSDSEGGMSEGEGRRKRSHQADRHQARGDQKNLKHNKHSSRGQLDSEGAMSDGGEKRRHRSNQAGERHFPGPMHELENNHARIENHKRQQTAPKLSAEEKAARALEMQRDAELHEEQRWKRLKKASEADAQEASRSSASGSRNFLDDAQKSVYGTKKGGSSTIEESVRRRTFYLQGKSEAHESNAFRR
ncbi:pre-mRNA-splicing factor CWC25 [Cinnamomum micranthum f. kanehirae]|uniref:Pre-mRNA-splicing factor CWC25 n=1 Tax=Cinnamomum micranthum f. kanehirae TaxID=337451 RepID=A0A443PYA4_9MAGN|nr:pre-mRNA-splicing factor CWC25 [Cinnamomum micranthum f. kanehirae]